MTTRRSAHRSEHTGNPALERVQNNVRDLQAFAKGELADFGWFHGVGLKRIAMQDRDYTLTAADVLAGTLIFSGPLTTTRKIIVPKVADVRAFQRWVENTTGQSLVFINADGSTTLTFASGRGFILVSSQGPRRYL